MVGHLLDNCISSESGILTVLGDAVLCSSVKEEIDWYTLRVFMKNYENNLKKLKGIKNYSLFYRFVTPKFFKGWKLNNNLKHTAKKLKKQNFKKEATSKKMKLSQIQIFT